MILLHFLQFIFACFFAQIYINCSSVDDGASINCDINHYSKFVLLSKLNFNWDSMCHPQRLNHFSQCWKDTRPEQQNSTQCVFFFPNIYPSFRDCNRWIKLLTHGNSCTGGPLDGSHCRVRLECYNVIGRAHQTCKTQSKNLSISNDTNIVIGLSYIHLSWNTM